MKFSTLFVKKKLYPGPIWTGKTVGEIFRFRVDIREKRAST